MQFNRFVNHIFKFVNYIFKLSPCLLISVELLRPLVEVLTFFVPYYLRLVVMLLFTNLAMDNATRSLDPVQY